MIDETIPPISGELEGPTPDGRCNPRFPVALEGASLRERGATRAPVIVQDLSLTGFRTEWAYTLTAGTVVWLTLPGLEPLTAKVVWNRDFIVGCEFDLPLHPAVLAAILKRSEG